MNEEFQKQLHLLYRYITYCFTFICLIFYGIGTCHASQHDMGYYSNHTDVYLSVPAAQADIFLAQDTYNQAGMFDIIYVYIDSLTINSNYVYQMEMSTPAAHLTNANAAIAVQYVNNGVNQGCNVLGVDDINSGFPKIYFQCKSSFSNGTMIFSFYDINGTTTGLSSNPNSFKWGYTYMRYFDDATDIDWGPITSNANSNADRIIANDNYNSDRIINNYNQKSTQDTRDIVNGAHQDANSIKNNQNANTDRQIDSQKVCKITNINNSSIIQRDAYLNGTGGIVYSSTYSTGVTDYIDISGVSSILNTSPISNTSISYYLCFYNSSKNSTRCISRSNYNNSSININSDEKYFRATIRYDNNQPTFSFNKCSNGNQVLSDDINSLNDSLNNDDTTGATSEANDFFSSFTTDTFGLTSIITAPLNLINSVLSSTCTSLQLPLPYLNNRNLELPCMSSIYSQYFGTFFTIYQTITYGIIAYWVCVRIFNQVKDFKNPEHDEIEVMDL